MPLDSHEQRMMIRNEFHAWTMDQKALFCFHEGVSYEGHIIFQRTLVDLTYLTKGTIHTTNAR